MKQGERRDRRSWGRSGLAAALLGLGSLPLAVATGGPAGAQPAPTAPVCASPGRDGTAALTGVVNTYHPGVGTAAAGARSISVGGARGAPTAIAAGDLLLVVQMQDATIDATNTGAYGDGVSGDPAFGTTDLGRSGAYEYVVATGAESGGAVGITGAGSDGGLLGSYASASATATRGPRAFQVVRVPQYAGATIGAGLVAAPWNGSTGAVVAVDVAGTLGVDGGSVSVSGQGFRGGGARQLNGDTGSNSDYRQAANRAVHGAKGEGLAGTPRFVFDPTTGTVRDLTTDGYPNGSMARGAPAQAGGGGTDGRPSSNDQNSGGGGGANAGAGGHGGNSWSSNLATGGFGGAPVTVTPTVVIAGGGGGAGTRNNDDGIPLASSGAAGGGIVMIRTGSTSGAGATISADGSAAFNDTLNDGGGGGGAGGTVSLTATGPLAGVSISATGGRGGDSWRNEPLGTNGSNRHGPGGGGGGGAVLTSVPSFAANVAGGGHGLATQGAAAYGSTAGTPGAIASIAPSEIPGAASGAECSTDPAITVSQPAGVAPTGQITHIVTVANYGGVTATNPVWTTTTPEGTTFTSLSAPDGWTCTTPAAGGTGPISCQASTLVTGPPWTFTVVTTVTALTGSIVLTAAVSSTGPPTDVDLGNNSASATTPIVNLGAPLADPFVGGITLAALALIGGAWWQRRRAHSASGPGTGS